MVHTSNAIITATLALSAVAPILGAPVEPRIYSGFLSVNNRAPSPPPPTQPPVTEPEAVPAPAPASAAIDNEIYVAARAPQDAERAPAAPAAPLIVNPLTQKIIRHLLNRGGGNDIPLAILPSINEDPDAILPIAESSNAGAARPPPSTPQAPTVEPPSSGQVPPAEPPSEQPVTPPKTGFLSKLPSAINTPQKARIAGGVTAVIGGLATFVAYAAGAKFGPYQAP